VRAGCQKFDEALARQRRCTRTRNADGIKAVCARGL
jgi:hypothetical protein